MNRAKKIAMESHNHNHYKPVSSISCAVPEPPSPDIWKRRTDIHVNNYPHTKYLKINGDTEKFPLENETVEVKDTEDEARGSKREEWGKKKDFMLTCVAIHVGLRHFWQFPYMCYKHGGGRFLIELFLRGIVSYFFFL